MFVCPECASTSDIAGRCLRDGADRVDGTFDPMLGLLVGSYRVAALLGSGGMGRVYRAVHPSIGSRVAIKVLRAEVAEHRDVVERFFAEARAVNHIQHPNIVAVLDAGRLEDDRPYILMELLEGESLAAMLERGPLSLPEVARIGGEVLAALDAAHRAGVVHRDIKPDNVFVAGDGRVKVLDFGIAKLQPELRGGAPTTATGAVLGTPHYLAPEQVSGGPIDGRADLYAVGAVLFDAATGRPPFDAPTPYQLLRMHISEPPPRPRGLRPDMSPAFERLILHALAKDPRDRPASAAELAAELARVPTASIPDWLAVAPTDPSEDDPPRTDTIDAPPLLDESSGAPTVAAGNAFALAPPPTLRMPEPRRIGGWIVGGVLALGVCAAGSAWWLLPGAEETRAEPMEAPPETMTAKAKRPPTPPTHEGDFDPVWPAFDPHRVDFGWYVEEARRIAATKIAAPMLSRALVAPVRADGTVDLGGRDFHEISVEFVDRQGSRCVELRSTGPAHHSGTVHASCIDTVHPMLRCPLATVVSRGWQLGARKQPPVASGTAPRDVSIGGSSEDAWRVDFGTVTITVPDDCATAR
jgi:serine/threonine protein kinase